jgi:signal peptidase II
MKVNRKELFLPFSLTAFVIILDQAVKAFIVSNWPTQGFIKDVFDNEILILYHVRNKAIAFSIGDNVSEPIRIILFIIVPVLVLIFLIWYYLKAVDFTRLQRWAIAGIIGGGFGNIIDRIFRIDGVVDYVSVKFYGIFGLQRWPTFNVADASVVICCITLLVTMFFTGKEEAKITKKETKITKEKAS